MCCDDSTEITTSELEGREVSRTTADTAGTIVCVVQYPGNENDGLGQKQRSCHNAVLIHSQMRMKKKGRAYQNASHYDVDGFVQNVARCLSRNSVKRELGMVKTVDD